VPDGQVQISGVGVDATADVLEPGAGAGLQAFEETTGDLAGLLGSESLEIQSTVELRDVEPEKGGRSTDTPRIELQAAAPDEGMEQVLLVKDEAGVLTWHFAEPGATRGDGGRTFVIDRRVFVAPQPGGPTRGLGSAVATKLLNVVVFPLVDPAAGKVADYFAGRWEAAKRPYRLRWSTPDDYAKPDGVAVQPADWDRLRGKRALLLVHGTFSRSNSGFGTLPRASFEELYRHYDGRVVALDHFTLSHTPRQNVDWLLGQIPDGVELDLDIVCHSRGGLVSRTLAERQSELSLGSRRLSVGRVIFVASPNAGTTLADASHLGDLVDLFTNLLNFIPDNGATDILPCVVTVVKMIAVGAFKGLDGLTAMAPAGEFLKQLNSGPAPEGVTYRALAADSEPGNAGFAAFAKDALMDRIFKSDNDLVVPTEGVFDQNGAGLFPIADSACHVFGATDGVSHTTFFSNRTTQEKLKEWLIGA
jgi:hypothetical protein